MSEYTISEIAALTDFSKHTLRYYEKVGVIQPKKKENGYRVYSDFDLEILKYITVMKFADFSLDDISFVLETMNPDLPDGYHSEQTDEILQIRELLVQADLIVFAFPVWWANMPAKLKGFIDHTFWVKESYSFQDGQVFFKGPWRGKRARVIYTIGGFEFLHWLISRKSAYRAVRYPLWTSGVLRVKKTVISCLDVSKFRKSDAAYQKKLARAAYKDIHALHM